VDELTSCLRGREELLVVVGTVIGWAGQQFIPRLWRRAGGSSLDIHVETDPRIFEAGLPDWIGYGLFFPAPPSEVPAPPERGTAQEWWAWGHSLGAHDAWSTKVSVTLTCKQDVIVAVDALSVQMIDQHPVPAGTIVVRPTGGADIVPRGVEIDLDGMGNSAITYYRSEGGENLPSLSISVKPDEIERLQIEGRAAHSVCKWRAQLHLLVDGRRETVEISNGGQPFITVGQGDRPIYTWNDDEWTRTDS
jgi:hypothetical protein